MAIQVRRMQEADAKAVSKLSAQLGYPQPEAATAAHIVSVLHSPDDCAFVAIEAENIVGWIHGFKTRRIETGMFAEIGGLVVDDTSRGKGIGKLLVETVRQWCLQQELHTLKVRSNVIRTDAHRFYGREGFSESKEQKVFEQHI